jgi:hypothetical protein
MVVVRRSQRTTLAAAILALMTVSTGWADALVVSRAMQADTIAEIFVEPNGIRVELEIGAGSIAAFRNLLPDEIYDQLEEHPTPWAERLQRFFELDWVIRFDGGAPAAGRLELFEGRRRVERDAITGEPLATGADAGEPVVYAILHYAFDTRPTSLSIAPPRETESDVPAASIGFMAYHHGLPVNDFRYLPAEVVLDLDWDDAWYSRFRNRNLRRQFDAPLNVFLYVEPFEVRKEIIVRPRDLSHWIDLGLDDVDTIAVSMQETLKERVAEYLGQCGAVTIDGVPARGTLDRIHFIRRTLRQTGVVDPPEDLPVMSATLGVIFVYPINGLPEEVALGWDLFSPRIQQVPGVAADEAGGLPMTLTADDPVLHWKNFLTNPTTPGLVQPVPPPARATLTVPIASALCAIAAITLAAVGWRGTSRGSWLVVGVVLVLAVATVLLSPLARVRVPSPVGGVRLVSGTEAGEIVGRLLGNVYRAFDYREEGAIYDALERSAAGDLLAQIYLETRRALELRNQGGARAKVEDVEMLAADATPLAEGDGFVSRCRWTVTGAVGHWGHIHQRQNQYEAEVTVGVVDGVWKITALELLDEQRL